MMEVEGGPEMDGAMMDGEGNNMASLDGKICLSPRPELCVRGSSFACCFCPADEIDDAMPAAPRVRRSARVAKAAQDTSKDVANCFGFDDDEEFDEDEDDK